MSTPVSAEETKAAAEKEEKRIERNLKVLALVVPFITLFLGAAISYGVMKYTNRIQELSCYISSSPNLFTKPELAGKDLVITLASKRIDNLSSATIYIRGAAQDLTDVPIHLRFAPVDGQPPRVIQVRPLLTPERYREVELPQLPDGSLRKGFIFGVWNRDVLVQLDCLFEGGTPPEITVDTMTKGVVVSREQTPKLDPIQQLPLRDKIVIFSLVGLGIVSLGIFEVKLLNYVKVIVKTQLQKTKTESSKVDKEPEALD